MGLRRTGAAIIEQDQTVNLLRRGYLWGRQLRAGRPAVRTRLFGRPAVLLGGPEGVRRFYSDSLHRRAAFPAPVSFVLFGPGSIHNLDDDEHHHRKAMFTELLGRRSLTDLAERAGTEWGRSLDAWPVDEPQTVFPLAVDTIARSVLPWAGIELDDHETLRRGRQLSRLAHGMMRPVLPYARAAADRVLVDRWAAELIMDVREGWHDAPARSLLWTTAHHRDQRGELLPPTTAAVELLNGLHSTIASAYFVTFAVLALQEHPEYAERLRTDAGFRLLFGQEVRRHYPFVPVVMARTRTEQSVLGHTVGPETLILLDVYGTNHDPDSWGDPETFQAERFGGDIPADAFVPQGGGDVNTGHRCPGEDVVLLMISSALQAFSSRRWHLPPQNLSWPTFPLPTRPRSDLVLRRLPDDR